MSDTVRNIYEKIQEAKRKLSETNIKKSGRNDFSKYDYYELSDFMPQVVKIFDELKLFSKVCFTNEAAILRIINTENTAEQEEYMLPMKDIEVKGSNAMQSLGSVTTYQRRYLYMIALDITESDSIDDKQKEDIQNAPESNPNGHNNNKNTVPEKSAPPPNAPKASELSEKQISRYHALKKQPAFSDRQMQDYFAKYFNKSEITQLTRKEYDAVCDCLQIKIGELNGGKSVPEVPSEQINIIYAMAEEISAAYKLAGKNQPKENIIGAIEKLCAKPLGEFTVKDTSTAIDFLAKKKLAIPKPNINPETGEVIEAPPEHDEDKFGNKLPWDKDGNMDGIPA